jgi:hypothetical protein
MGILCRLAVSKTVYQENMALYLENLPGNYLETCRVRQVVPKYRLTSVRRGTATPHRVRGKLAADFAHCLTAYAANPAELSAEYL